MTKYNVHICIACLEELEISEGDILQIFQENLDSLEVTCPHCDYPNEIIISDIDVTIKNISEIYSDENERFRGNL